MDIFYLFSAFVVGLLGSVHCLGMCGPIALMLPIGQESKAMIYARRSVYNFGRIATYTVMGILVGLFGSTLGLLGWQQQLSIFSGVVLILYVVVAEYFSTPKVGLQLDWLVQSISKFAKRPGFGSQFTLGLVNGLLPCGFVYVGLMGALNAGSTLASGIYMALFGLGTFPMMFLAGVIGPSLPISMRNKILKFAPIMTIILGILFILRGLELGIPMISPAFNPEAMSGGMNHMHH